MTACSICASGFAMDEGGDPDKTKEQSLKHVNSSGVTQAIKNEKWLLQEEEKKTILNKITQLHGICELAMKNKGEQSYLWLDFFILQSSQTLATALELKMTQKILQNIPAFIVPPVWIDPYQSHQQTNNLSSNK